jgi:hypothetical protein
MALDVTVGGAAAESYATVAEMKAYNAVYVSLYPTALSAVAWAAASDATLENAARIATRLLDAYPRAWAGTAVDAVQALGFPRSGLATRNGYPIPTAGAGAIPTDLKNAESELARQLLVTDRTVDNAIINKGLTSLKAGSVALAFDSVKIDNSLQVARIVRELNALAAILPDAVKNLIPVSWWKLDVEDVKIRRTSEFEAF